MGQYLLMSHWFHTPGDETNCKFCQPSRKDHHHQAGQTISSIPCSTVSQKGKGGVPSGNIAPYRQRGEHEALSPRTRPVRGKPCQGWMLNRRGGETAQEAGVREGRGTHRIPWCISRTGKAMSLGCQNAMIPSLPLQRNFLLPGCQKHQKVH